VGEEERIEFASLGDPGQFLPVGDVADVLDARHGSAPCGFVVAHYHREQIQGQRSLRRGGHQPFTRPPSTIRFCPVTPRDHGWATNRTASASGSGVVTSRSGVPAAIPSKTSAGVALEASVVRSKPPETMFTAMPPGPRSSARVLVSASRAAFVAV